MKVRDSGMPEKLMWEGFFDARHILKQLGFGEVDGDAVEFGCGYGTFTVAAAGMTHGKVYALDIEPEMTKATALKAQESGLQNVRVVLRDFVAEGTGLPNGAVDFAMLFNILHAEDPQGLLREAFRALRPGGRVGIIHWIYDASTPRGPNLNIRPKPEQCQSWLRETGFELVGLIIALPPYHYGLVGCKPTEKTL